MDELLKSKGAQLSPLNRGDKIKATILKIGKREILADIGGKSYGIVIGRQFDLVKPFLGQFKVGDQINAMVIIPEMDSGETLISFKQTAMDTFWEELQQAKESGKEIDVTVLKAVSGGLLVNYRDLRGFIPQTQLDSDSAANPVSLTDKRVKVKVLEVDQSQNRLVLSQKEVTEKEGLAAKRKTIGDLKVGDKVAGEITAIDKYGLMVTFVKGKTELTGQVHISEIAWERVENLEELFKVGDKIKAVIVSLDKGSVRIGLSLKALLDDPWQKAAEKYAAGKTVSGTVVKTSSLGAFVELEKGVEALLHVSKISAGKEFKVGEKLAVVVEKVDVKNRKISLSYIPKAKPIGYR